MAPARSTRSANSVSSCIDETRVLTSRIAGLELFDQFDAVAGLQATDRPPPVGLGPLHFAQGFRPRRRPRRRFPDRARGRSRRPARGGPADGRRPAARDASRAGSLDVGCSIRHGHVSLGRVHSGARGSSPARARDGRLTASPLHVPCGAAAAAWARSRPGIARPPHPHRLIRRRQGNEMVTRVPRPGRRPTCKRPPNNSRRSRMLNRPKPEAVGPLGLLLGRLETGPLVGNRQLQHRRWERPSVVTLGASRCGRA